MVEVHLIETNGAANGTEISPVDLPPLEKARNYFLEQQALAKQKDRLAQMAAQILENPEENVNQILSFC